MKFSVVFTTLLSTVALASPVALADNAVEVRAAKPDRGQVVANDFVTLGKDLVKLNTTLNGFKKGLGAIGTALKIRQQAIDINNLLKQAIKDTDSSGNFGDDSSTAIATAVLDDTTPIQETLANLVSKRSVFNSILGLGDLSKTVYNLLVELRANTQTLGDKVVPKLTDLYRSIAPDVIAGILQNFDDAIAAYKKCTGVICLPPIPS